MPRKLRVPLPPTTDYVPEKPAPPITLVGDNGSPRAEERKKPGPKPKAQIQDEIAAKREMAALKPDEIRPLTAMVLIALCKALKGDLPNEREIEMVNGPACAVANKYSMSNKWAVELALVGSVALVVKNSRDRMREKHPQNLEPAPVDRARTAKPTPPIQAVTFPGRSVGACATISGDESKPDTAASGHRSPSIAVKLPDPQPRSATRVGSSVATRDTRSTNGRDRSPE